MDQATGAAVLTCYLAVDDAGITIDHEAAEAQIYGGVAQGVGESSAKPATLCEPDGLQCAQGQRFPDYRLLESNTPSPFNPLGVKGIGEAGTTGALCAVTNSVADALCGRDLPTIPLTQERL